MTPFDGLGKLPPAAATLGWRFEGLSEGSDALLVSFEGLHEFTTPSGDVHGGFLAAMLIEIMSSTVTAASGGASLGAPVSMSVDFVRPAPPGRLKGEGRVTLMGKNIAFLEGRLFSGDELVARSTGSCRLFEIQRSWLRFDDQDLSGDSGER